MAITLAIAVFVFNFTLLAFVTVVSSFVLGILFKFVTHVAGNKYRAKNKSRLIDSISSHPHESELEEEEVFTNDLKNCLCCSPQKEDNDIAKDEI